MNESLKNNVITKMMEQGVRFAAMDYDNKWYGFQNRPDWVDGTWDVKDGDFVKLKVPFHDRVDNRESLICLGA